MALYVQDLHHDVSEATKDLGDDLPGSLRSDILKLKR